MNRPLALALSALALGMAVSCAAGPSRWQKPGADQDQWSRDRAACQSFARKEAERRYSEKASETASPVYGSGRTLEKNMALHDAQREQRKLFENCLRFKGYAKTQG